MNLIIIALAVAAVYCGGMWIVLAALGMVRKADYETETFHLGLCFLLAIGFLGLILK
jgi:flagellar biosynthesis protein FliR